MASRRPSPTPFPLPSLRHHRIRRPAYRYQQHRCRRRLPRRCRTSSLRRGTRRLLAPGLRLTPLSLQNSIHGLPSSARASSAFSFVFLAQPGTSVNGAYNVLVAIAVVISMVPFMFLFASLIRLQREPVAPDVLRIPGGRPVAILLGSVGFLTCAFATVLSLRSPIKKRLNPFGNFSGLLLGDLRLIILTRCALERY